MGLNLLISLLRFVKFTAPLIAIAFFGTWLTRVYGDEDTFQALDFLMGFLPKIMDKILYFELDINGMDISIGYILASILMIALSIVAIKILKVLEKYQKLKDENEFQREMLYMELLRKHQKEKEEKEKQEAKEKLEKEELEKINTFYALFELKTNYLNPENKNLNNLQKLKLESSKIIANKLQEKYSTMKFVIKDKIFIIFKDLSSLVDLIKDIIKLYKTIAHAGEKKLIQTDFLMSFHASSKEESPKVITKTLIMINNLKNINKIVATDCLFKKYTSQNKDKLAFESLGTIRFENLSNDNSEVEIELYNIKNEQVTI